MAQQEEKFQSSELVDRARAERNKKLNQLKEYLHLKHTTESDSCNFLQCSLKFDDDRIIHCKVPMQGTTKVISINSFSDWHMQVLNYFQMFNFTGNL